MSRSTIKEITFFKVPFDNSYRNVYTFPYGKQTDSYIYQKFVEHFSNTVWNISAAHPVVFKETNGKIILSATYNVIDIKDYNYCSIKYHKITKDGESDYWKFYFIIGYSSMNQGINPTTELSLEYDCWLNNLQNITGISDEFTMIQGHINDCVKINNLIYPKHIVSSDKNFPTTIVSTNELVSNIRILWLKCTLTGESGYYYKKTDGPGGSIKGEIIPASCISSNAQLPIIYAPVGVYDFSQNKFLDGCTLTSTHFSEDGEGKPVTETHTIKISNFNFNMVDDDSILEAELTYYPPFLYSKSADSNTFSLIVNGDNYIYNLYRKINEAYIPVVSNRSPELYAGVVTGKTGTLITNTKLTFTYSIENNSMSYSSYILSTNKRYTQGASLTYPFKFNKLLIGSKEFTLIFPNNAKNCRITLTIDGLLKYYIIEYIGYDGSILSKSLEIPLTESFQIPVTSNPESVFYRNNANQYLAQQNAISTRFQVESISNAIRVLTARKTSSIGGNLFSQVSAAYEYELQNEQLSAKISDIRNAPETVENVSNNALLNLHRFDAFLIVNLSSDADTIDAINTLDDIYRYGYKVNKSSTINDLPMNIFNYKQFSSFIASTIYNINERKTIENALTNGVTIWNFMSDTDSDAVIQSKTDMQKTTNNLVKEVL